MPFIVWAALALAIVIIGVGTGHGVAALPEYLVRPLAETPKEIVTASGGLLGYVMVIGCIVLLAWWIRCARH